jgi:hypothetical protein
MVELWRVYRWMDGREKAVKSSHEVIAQASCKLTE